MPNAIFPAHSNPEWPPSLVLDFDSTLTTASTLPALLTIPTEIFANRAPLESSNPSFPPTAAELSDAYTADRTAHFDLYKPNEKERTNLLHEYTHQHSLRGLEGQSLDRGKDAFHKARVIPADVQRVAQRCIDSGDVVFRKGWKRMLAIVTRKHGRIGIVSTNWSKIWIESLIEAAAKKEGLIDQDGQVLLDGLGLYRPCGKKLDIEVRANEVVWDPEEKDVSEVRLRGGDDDGSRGEKTVTSTARKRRKAGSSVRYSKPMVLSPKRDQGATNLEQDGFKSRAVQSENDPKSSRSNTVERVDSRSFANKERELASPGKRCRDTDVEQVGVGHRIGSAKEDSSSLSSADTEEAAQYRKTNVREPPQEDSDHSSPRSSAPEAISPMSSPENLASTARKTSALSTSSREDPSDTEDARENATYYLSDVSESSQPSSDSDLDSKMVSSDSDDHSILDAYDKDRAVHSLNSVFSKQIQNSSPSRLDASKDSIFATLIYFGDSATDLAALMSVDTGIIIRDKGPLQGEQLYLHETLKRLGFPLGHVGAWKHDRGQIRLWWAYDFDEVVNSGILELET